MKMGKFGVIGLKEIKDGGDSHASLEMRKMWHGV
jgi:hypothetical protein